MNQTQQKSKFHNQVPLRLQNVWIHCRWKVRWVYLQTHDLIVYGHNEISTMPVNKGILTFVLETD